MMGNSNINMQDNEKRSILGNMRGPLTKHINDMQAKEEHLPNDVRKKR